MVSRIELDIRGFRLQWCGQYIAQGLPITEFEQAASDRLAHSMAIILRQTAYFHTAKGWRAAVSAPNLKIDQTADDCLPQFSIQRLRLNWWLLRERDHSTFSSPSVIFQAAGRRVSFSIGKVSVNER
jgi:hypothetical protein